MNAYSQNSYFSFPLMPFDDGLKLLYFLFMNFREYLFINFIPDNPPISLVVKEVSNIHSLHSLIILERMKSYSTTDICLGEASVNKLETNFLLFTVMTRNLSSPDSMQGEPRIWETLKNPLFS